MDIGNLLNTKDRKPAIPHPPATPNSLHMTQAQLAASNTYASYSGLVPDGGFDPHRSSETPDLMPAYSPHPMQRPVVSPPTGNFQGNPPYPPQLSASTEASASASQLPYDPIGNRNGAPGNPNQPQTPGGPQMAQPRPGGDGPNPGEGELPKAFACSTCQKGFARRSDLVRHERIHSGVRPHVCSHPGCGKQFIQRSALTVHERVHTREKPHLCEKCGKPFSDSSSLARHRRIHSGTRPYQCPYADCQKTFTRRTTLTRHQNHHTGTVEEAEAARAAALASRANAHVVDQQPQPEHADGEGQSDASSAASYNPYHMAPAGGTLPRGPNQAPTMMQQNYYARSPGYGKDPQQPTYPPPPGAGMGPGQPPPGQPNDRFNPQGPPNPNAPWPQPGPDHRGGPGPHGPPPMGRPTNGGDGYNYSQPQAFQPTPYY